MSTEEKHGWLAAKMDDPEFQKLFAREEIIETFLNQVDEAMERKKIKRAELARRMQCKPANITRIMRRTSNLTVATMSDIVFFLGLKLIVSVHEKNIRKRENVVTLRNPNNSNKYDEIWDPHPTEYEANGDEVADASLSV